MHTVCQLRLIALAYFAILIAEGKLDAMRHVITIGLAAIWFIVVVLWPKESNLPVKEDSDGYSEQGLYQSSLTKAYFGLLGADFYESVLGKKHWNIKSKFAELHRKENYAFMKVVNAQFFSGATDNVINTQSDYGRSWLDRNIVQLEGNVAVQSQKGYRFSMNRLDYDGKIHQFRSEELVRMKGPDIRRPTMYLQGTGLVADIDQERFRLKHRVSARKQLQTTNWLDVTSQTGEFFTDQQRALFQKSVRAKMPKVTIASEQFEIGMSEGKEFLLAEKNVRIVNRNRLGSAERAFMEIGGNQIILEGNARIDADEDHVQGKRIVISTDDDRLEVEQAEGRSTK